LQYATVRVNAGRFSLRIEIHGEACASVHSGIVAAIILLLEKISSHNFQVVPNGEATEGDAFD
jgi:hypothetical protein